MSNLVKNLRQFLGLRPLPETILCMMLSEQEGAEIWIEGENTGHLTPHLVKIPKDRDVKVEFKLFAYETHTAWVRSGSNLTYYYCQLNRVPLRLIVNEDTQALSL